MAAMAARQMSSSEAAGAAGIANGLLNVSRQSAANSIPFFRLVRAPP